MKPKTTRESKIKIEQLKQINHIEEIDNLEAAQISGGRGYRYSGPVFQSGDENMANESIELVHEGIVRLPV